MDCRKFIISFKMATEIVKSYHGDDFISWIVTFSQWQSRSTKLAHHCIGSIKGLDRQFGIFKWQIDLPIGWSMSMNFNSFNLPDNNYATIQWPMKGDRSWETLLLRYVFPEICSVWKVLHENEKKISRTGFVRILQRCRNGHQHNFMQFRKWSSILFSLQLVQHYSSSLHRKCTAQHCKCGL